MKLVKIGAAVLNQTPLDWEGNKKNIIAAIDRAKSEQVSILCLPELCITGYGCEDAFHSPGLQQTAVDVLHEILPHTAGIIVSLGMPLLLHNALFNTACLCTGGAILGFAAKRFLAGDGIHYEPRWFRPWPEHRLSLVDVRGQEYPIGNLLFDCGGVRIGFEICEDAWVANRPGSSLSQKAVDIILNPSASHFAFGKSEVRKRFVIDGSRAFGVSYVYANLLGNESGRVIYDGGAIIASAGRLVVEGPRFSFRDFALTSAVVDIDATRTAQTRSGGFSPELEPKDEARISTKFQFPEILPEHQAPPASTWEESAFVKEEEFGRAVALGLFDYLRKCAADGFVVSLSGGADSSACTCLAAAMVHLGTDELGFYGLAEKLRFRGGLTGSETAEKEVVGKLLVCIYQATKNSSETTRRAAQEVAQGAGAQFLSYDVESLVSSYVGLAEGALGRKLTWEHDDAALQNIQARVRAPGAWLIANVRNSLLLVTSNRSEAAVGYATMDGDTAGSLSPIGGVDKAFLRRWNHWLETSGLSGEFRVPALSFVNAQQPTAELRPAGSHQTDEADLMPYDVLDRIERAAVLDRQTPIEIFLRLRAEFPQHGTESLYSWIERFLKLWCRNQWKRERYAPSFHLDDESLDPKTWCRFPILSGGYKRELAALRRYIDERQPGK